MTTVIPPDGIGNVLQIAGGWRQVVYGTVDVVVVGGIVVVFLQRSTPVYFRGDSPVEEMRRTFSHGMSEILRSTFSLNHLVKRHQDERSIDSERV